MLEERRLLSTFTVLNTNDSGPGSFRQALLDANANPGLDTIVFNIGAGGVQTIRPLSALPTVTDAVFIDGTSQAGYDPLHPTPMIELDGSLAGFGVTGLILAGGNCTVRGLVINRFGGDGLLLTGLGGDVIQGNYIGTDLTGTVALGNGSSQMGGLFGGFDEGIKIDNTAGNTIGGTTAADRNLVAGSVVDGIQVAGSAATANLVIGNYVGTDVTGTIALRNAFSGVAIFGGAHDNTIGGVGTGNVISGNGGSGVYISDAATGGNQVIGNSIGVSAAGTAGLGNGVCGVEIVNGATANIVGGTAAGMDNVISANGSDGVQIRGAGTNDNLVEGNFIGTDVTGMVGLGNRLSGVAVFGGPQGNTIGGAAAGAGNLISANGADGVFFADPGTTANQVLGNSIGVNAVGAALGNASDGVQIVNFASWQTIKGNVIAFNGSSATPWHSGVLITGGTGNAISQNSIFGNAFLGIDLGGDGVTLNDSLVHAGPNNYQDFPVPASASSIAGVTTIQGTLHGAANSTFTVEFFASPSGDPSGYGQGQEFLGSASVTTDASGNANFTAVFTASIAHGWVVSATATDTNGNTSEFSQVISVKTAGILTLTSAAVTATEGAAFSGIVASFTDSDGDPANNFTATINWSDGQTSVATIAASAKGGFDISTSRDFADEGSLSFTVQLTDSDGTSASVSGTATVNDAPLNGAMVTIDPIAGAPFQGVVASFSDGNPNATAGEFTATISWGDGASSMGVVQSNGQGGFTVSGAHTYAAPSNYTLAVQIADVGGSTASATGTVNVTALGQPIQDGQTATLGFWTSQHGRELIESFNGGPGSTALANWLATTLPHLFGASAGVLNVAGKTNAELVDFFRGLHPFPGVRLDAQILVTALNVYATTLSLGGTTAQSYGFLVTADGLGAASFNVGHDGKAIGVANGVTLNVYQILKAADGLAVNGVLWAGHPKLREEAFDLFRAINHRGEIEHSRQQWRWLHE
jgi:hypothetical protein